MTKQKLYKATRLCVSACIWNENGPKLAADFHFKVFCSKFKRKPRRWKRTDKTGPNVVMQSKMVTQAALFHYFPSDCRCHSYRDLKTEYGAVKMVLHRAEIPGRHSRSVWSEAESWVWNPQQYLRKPAMQGNSWSFSSALPEREVITGQLNCGKSECRAIWREMGKDYGIQGDISEICSKLCIWALLQTYLTTAQPRSRVSLLNQHFLKQIFVFTDDSRVTSVNWGWKVPKQRQYKKSTNMWLPLSESEA